MKMISIAEAVEEAIETLPRLQRVAIRARLNRGDNRTKLYEKLMEKLLEDDECCEIAPNFCNSVAICGSTFSSQTVFGIDPDKLERFLQIIVEYLPKILAIILPLFTKMVLLIACSIAFSQVATALPPAIVVEQPQGTAIVESIPPVVNLSSAVQSYEQCKNCRPLRETAHTAAAIATKTAETAVRAAAVVADRIVPDERAGLSMSEHARAMTQLGGTFHSSGSIENVYWSSDGANRLEARRAWRNSPAHKANLRRIVPILGVKCRGNACVARGR